MTRFATLEPTVLVAPQISETDLAAAKEAGVTVLISNRVDGEEPGAPLSDAVRAWADTAGMAFHHIPVAGGQLTGEAVKAMADALDTADGKVLAFCKSGTRSAVLWAVARAAQGDHDPDALARATAQAGYDLGPMAGMLKAAQREGLAGL